MATASRKLARYAAISSASSNRVLRIAATSAMTAPTVACSDFMQSRSAANEASSSIHDVRRGISEMPRRIMPNITQIKLTEKTKTLAD